MTAHEYYEGDQRGDAAAAGRSTRDNLRLGASIGLGILLVLFVLMNTDKTRIDFIVTDVRMPLIFVLIGTAIVGGVVSQLGLYVLRRRRQKD